MVEGDQITPNLRLIRSLGRTESSHVWVARDSKLEKDVAVKILDKPLPRHSPQLHRFQREADVAGHIRSAHVAHVLAHGTSTTGLPYLEMELLEGEDLVSRLTRQGPMSVGDVARLVSQLARGLGKAHMLGLVHRNLKPANVFLVETPEGGVDAKVLDVGLSSSSELTSNGKTSSGANGDGAFSEYASPEQIFGVKDVDFRADLWAIAVVAFYALTGRTPFAASDADAFAKAVEKATFSPPSSLVAGLPAAIDAWFVKALQRDPTARFGGAKELADEFVRAAGIDAHERLARPSVVPALSAPRTAMRSSLDLTPGRISVTGLSAKDVVPSKDVTVIAANTKERSSSAFLIAILALVGIGTLLAGLTLLHR